MVETPFNPEETPDGSGQAIAGEVAVSTAEPVAEAAVAEAAVAEPAAQTAPITGIEEPETVEAAGLAPVPQLAEPVPAPPEPAPSEPAAAAAVPSIASVLEVPPLEPAGEAGGGEWELLVDKLQTWFEQLDLAGQWDRIRGPLKGIAILVVVLIALRTYAAVVGTIDSIPLVSGLLELVGVVAFTRFAWDNLLRNGERQKLLSDWQRRWSDFSGKN
jgi:hypothetical protein